MGQKGHGFPLARRQIRGPRGLFPFPPVAQQCLRARPSIKSDWHSNLPGQEAQNPQWEGLGLRHFGWATASCLGCDTGLDTDNLDKHVKGSDQEGGRHTWVRGETDEDAVDALQGGEESAGTGHTFQRTED